jgi:hypothetical protein
MAIAGATAVKVIPWMSGSRTPIFQNPTDWMMEQIRVNEVRQLLFREPDGTRDQYRHYDRAGVERQHVLEPVYSQPPRRKHRVHGVGNPTRPLYRRCMRHLS